MRDDEILPDDFSTPHIAMASYLAGGQHILIRESNESEARYQSRVEVLNVLLDFARRTVA